MTELAPAFTPGQSVMWLSQVLGTYGPDWIDDRNVVLVEATVVKVGAKRVQIQESTSSGRSRLVWIDPANLRLPDDPAIIEAMRARPIKGIPRTGAG